MNKAIFSLDKFAEGNRLSSNQLSTIKGGRKKLTPLKVKSENSNGNKEEDKGNLSNPSNNDGGLLLLTPPTSK